MKCLGGDQKEHIYLKDLHFSFYVIVLYLYCLVSCKMFLTWPSLIDREPNVKIQVFYYYFFRADLVSRISYQWIFREDFSQESLLKVFSFVVFYTYSSATFI